MGKIIAFVHLKGGTGKTTTTCKVGHNLVRAGKKVLFVDLDCQACLSDMVGVKLPQTERNILTVLNTDGTDIRSCIGECKKNLSIIAASPELRNASEELQSRENYETLLSHALEPIKDEYDYILIDCPPQLSAITRMALVAADGIIIPTTTDTMALRGINKVLEMVAKVKGQGNPELEVYGYVVTMYDECSDVSVHGMDVFQENNNVLGVIPVPQFGDVTEIEIAYKELAEQIAAIS